MTDVVETASAVLHANSSGMSESKQLTTTTGKDRKDVQNDGKIQASDHIIDIRRPAASMDLIQELQAGLDKPQGTEKRIPTLLLYDEPGLRLFEEITYLDEYYLTNSEIELLTRHAKELAERVPDNSIIVELGSGNLRKVDIVLRAIDALGKHINYYALDLDRPELERTLAAVQEKEPYQHIRCFGLWGTYDDGLAWLQTPAVSGKRCTVLSLGSSIGNFSREAAAEFLQSFVDVLGPNDHFLLAVDRCSDADRVYHAYNDSKGVTHKFILNGLAHANSLAGEQVFDLAKWQVIGEYNDAAHRHQAFVSPTENVNVLGVAISAGEKLRIEESHKYNDAEITQLWDAAGVREIKRWTDSRGDHAMHLISKQPPPFPSEPEQYAATAAPTWDQWTHLWSVWDTVTLQMIPQEELHEKPIKLRNACIFYLGHIPAFFDIKLTHTWPEQGPTEPAYYHQIFERGIDPDVDNPEHCHAHSEIPSEWPPLDEMLAYQQRVRARVQALYDSGEWQSKKAGRVLWLGYEHECMHLETLLYMLLQSDKTKAPADAPEPDFATLARQAEAKAVPNQWFTIPEQEITLGISDPENDDGPERYFGWDIEKPQRKTKVPSFEAKARPITIGEYAEYLQEKGINKLPESWKTLSSPPVDTSQMNGATTNGSVTTKLTEAFLANKAVRTVYGLVPLAQALTWPCSASYDELSGCAAWMGGRIPTAEEARSIYSYVDAQKALATVADGRTIPAVNGHLVNNGVRESPPSKSPAKPHGGEEATLQPRTLFSSLADANVGFQGWHPTSVAHAGATLAGQAEMGGLWEWTATPLTPHEGYEPMPLYPAYSADFFDGKHNIVLGGSWATPPRIAGRKSFVNWYQRNYPYVWAGARLVRDV